MDINVNDYATRIFRAVAWNCRVSQIIESELKHIEWDEKRGHTGPLPELDAILFAANPDAAADIAVVRADEIYQLADRDYRLARSAALIFANRSPKSDRKEDIKFAVDKARLLQKARLEGKAAGA
jgi:hypothetical protein